MFDTGPTRRTAREQLPGTSGIDRALMVRDHTLAVYNHLKLRDPEGGGMDGASGPERERLAKILDLAHEHYQACVAEGLDKPNTMGVPE